jgi:DNA-binding NtrC family response regulator
MATILIVDDDPLQASLLMSLLGQQFGNVCRVNDAAEALCLIEQPEFATKLSLVITGNHITGIGGLVFLPRPVGGDKMLAVTSQILSDRKPVVA